MADWQAFVEDRVGKPDVVQRSILGDAALAELSQYPRRSNETETRSDLTNGRAGLFGKRCAQHYLPGDRVGCIVWIPVDDGVLNTL